jgi:hypothetical protein
VPAPFLLRFLAIAALLLAPLAMIGGGPAEAAPPEVAIEAPSHEAGGHMRSKEAPCCSVDCMTSCAAILALGSEVAAMILVPAPVQPMPLATVGGGLEPEAATPPPRPA